MGNFSQIFPQRTTFAGDGLSPQNTPPGSTAVWAQGTENDELIPFSKIEAFQIGAVWRFNADDGDNTVAAVRTFLYANTAIGDRDGNTVTLNSGDVAIVNYDDTDGNEQTVSFLYSAEGNVPPRPDDFTGVTTEQDWTIINFAANAVQTLEATDGLRANSEVGNITIWANNKILDDGALVDDATEIDPTNRDRAIGDINFTGNAIGTITRDGHNYNVPVNQSRTAFSTLAANNTPITDPGFNGAQITEIIVRQGEDPETANQITFNGPGLTQTFALGGQAAVSTAILNRNLDMLGFRASIAANLRPTAVTHILRGFINNNPTATDDSSDPNSIGQVVVSGNGVDPPRDTYRLTGITELDGDYEWEGIFDATTNQVPAPASAATDSTTLTFSATSPTPIAHRPIGTIVARQRFIELGFNDQITGERQGFVIDYTTQTANPGDTLDEQPLVPFTLDANSRHTITATRGQRVRVRGTIRIVNADLYEFPAGNPTNFDTTYDFTVDATNTNPATQRDQRDYPHMMDHVFSGAIAFTDRIDSVTFGDRDNRPDGTFRIPFTATGTPGTQYTMSFAQAEGHALTPEGNITNSMGTAYSGGYTLPASTADTSSMSGFVVGLPQNSLDTIDISFVLRATVMIGGEPVNTDSAIRVERSLQAEAEGNLSVQDVDLNVIGDDVTGRLTMAFNITGGDSPVLVDLFQSRAADIDDTSTPIRPQLSVTAPEFNDVITIANQYADLTAMTGTAAISTGDLPDGVTFYTLRFRDTDAIGDHDVILSELRYDKNASQSNFITPTTYYTNAGGVSWITPNTQTEDGEALDNVSVTLVSQPQAGLGQLTVNLGSTYLSPNAADTFRLSSPPSIINQTNAGATLRSRNAWTLTATNLTNSTTILRDFSEDPPAPLENATISFETIPGTPPAFNADHVTIQAPIWTYGGTQTAGEANSLQSRSNIAGAMTSLGITGNGFVWTRTDNGGTQLAPELTLAQLNDRNNIPQNDVFVLNLSTVLQNVAITNPNVSTTDMGQGRNTANAPNWAAGQTYSVRSFVHDGTSVIYSQPSRIVAPTTILT